MTTTNNPINDQAFTSTLEYLQSPETFDFYSRILSACQLEVLEGNFISSSIDDIDILRGLHTLRKCLATLAGVDESE